MRCCVEVVVLARRKVVLGYGFVACPVIRVRQLKISLVWSFVVFQVPSNNRWKLEPEPGTGNGNEMEEAL